MKVLQAVDNGNACTLVLGKERFAVQPQIEPMLPFSRDFHDQLVIMHQPIFPDVYVSGSDILHSIRSERQVLCAVHQKTLVGYIVHKRKNAPSEMTIEILAVDSPFRSQGYGKALLNAGLQRIFETPPVEKAGLVVENINSTAKHLYASFGFVTHTEFHSYQVVFR